MSDSRWWSSLRHGGLLIAPSRIAELFPAELAPLTGFDTERLRREWLRWRSGDDGHQLVEMVLEWVCGLNDAYGRKWVRGSDVDTSWSRRALTGEVIRPRRLWLAEHGTVLPVFVDSEARLGVGRGRRAVARVVEWLRATEHKVALVTNGRQFRLLYAGSDYEAWCEWDAALWFEDGTPGPQVDAFRALLSVDTLLPKKANEASKLLRAIDLSRKGQAELSGVLGERVRRAVELLIQAHGKALDSDLGHVAPRDIYRAAARIVMRLVVGFFAEARDLLPRDNPLYHESYGLNGLREELGALSGGERLRHRYGAYSRILALFRLIYEGCHHEALPVLRYGGGLFSPGSSTSPDPVSVALATLERGNHDVSDDVVAGILELLCTTRVKVRQGRATTWVMAPVDFSDLSSEYIGILYEGLLDYELKRSAENDPTVFLALGAQPALPLSRLEAMDDRALKNLVEALKKKKKGDTEGDEDAEEEAEEEEEEEESDEDGGGEEEPEDVAAEDASTEGGAESPRADALRRARAWARRAALVGGLVSRRGRRKNVDDDPELEAAAKKLVRDGDVKLPGQWFLVRWGGMRKGHGTFYTRPQLTVPVVHRTLRALAYDAPSGSDGVPDELAPAAAWTPKRPADILSLRVSDPAMGSGSFLVAALRFLTDALFASLHHYGCIAAQGDGALVSLPFGEPAAGSLTDFLLPTSPDADDFEVRLRARLKRFVLERCLYGVDIDPLAVELARLSLWVETMDRDIPFEFLRHKFKNGNSLIGCWFDRYQDYPALAWMREGGDKDREGVHHEKSKWTRAISAMKDSVRAGLVDVLTNQLSLLRNTASEAVTVRDDVAAALDALHQPPLKDPEEQDARYRKAVEDREDLIRLREAFDTWCAIWFWPAERLDSCPLAHDLLAPSADALAVVRELHTQHKFFHWELEFPDVFQGADTGFDAIVGNPPWEIQKPNSLEFFSNLDPLYRSYTKTEGLARQKELFRARETDEEAWVSYNAELKAKSNWVKNVGNPWGDAANDTTRFALGRGRAADALHEQWAAVRAQRRSFADVEHPCRHQGSGDINTYKLFLEQSHALLRPGGRLGMLVPSGIYSDLGSRDLRTLFLGRCRWDWLYAFQNERFVFEGVHHSFKVAVLGLVKGGKTEQVYTRFRLGPGGSPEAGELEEDLRVATDFVVVPVSLLQRLSPSSRALPELESAGSLRIVQRVYEAGVLVGATEAATWLIEASRELHMTDDRGYLRKTVDVEADGGHSDAYARWVLPDGGLLAPLYEGRLFNAFDFAAKAWLRGTGMTAVWEEVSWERKKIRPQYLVPLDRLREHPLYRARPKLSFRNIARSTDTRTFIGTVLVRDPTPHMTSNWFPARHFDAWMLAAICNSFVFDFVARLRLVGTHLDWHVVCEFALPARADLDALGHVALRLSSAHERYAPEWMRYASPLCRAHPWRRAWAITSAERLRLRAILDAVAAALYGLDTEGFGFVLRGCDFPVARIGDKSFSRSLDTKGFWRVDKDVDPELRLPVLALVAFRDLQEAIRREGDVLRGAHAFLSANDGDGWMLPEAVRLADYGLGHDERAREMQPVASRLGPRFLSWQLEQSAEESWAECERHACAILGDIEFATMMEAASAEPSRPHAPGAGVGSAHEPTQGALFSAAATAPTGLVSPKTTGKKRRL